MRENFVWNMLGNGIFALSQWGLLMAIAKVGSVEEAETRLGIFALGLAVTQPVVQLANLQLRQMQATDAQQRFSPRAYAAARSRTTLAFVLALGVGLAVSGYEASVAAVIGLVTLAKAAEAMSDVAYGRFEFLEQMQLSAKSLVLRGITGLLGFTTGLLVGNDLVWACAGWAAAWFLIWIAHDRRCSTPPPDTPPPDRSTLWALVVAGIPLGMVTALTALVQNVPRYLLEALASSRELGVFAALSFFSSALRMPVLATAGAVAPRLARRIQTGEGPTVGRLLGQLVALSAVPGIVALAAIAMAGEPILALVYRPSFSPHAPILMLLLVGATLGFVAHAFRTALTASLAYRPQVPIVAATLVITGIAGWLWIPGDPLHGAAMAIVAGRSFQCIAAAGTFAYVAAARRRARAG